MGQLANLLGYKGATGLKSINNLDQKSMVVDIVSNFSYRGSSVNDNSTWFFGNDGVDYKFSFNGHADSQKAYIDCPPISAIINKKAQAYINGKVRILNTQGKDANTDFAKKLKKLMSRPNKYQSWRQFEAQAYIYQQLFGYTIVLPIKPVGFPNIDASELWNIPPFMVKIKENKKLFFDKASGNIISEIELKYKETKVTLDPESVFIVKDFTPNFESIVIPQSRVKGAQMPINNLIGAVESLNVLINNRGASGILSTQTDATGMGALLPADKEQVQTDYSQYGTRKGQKRLIITNANLKWQQMGLNAKELLLHEEIKSCTEMICDQWGYPFELLSNEKGTTFANKEEAKKLLYQDTIIPEAENNYEQWSQFFQMEENNVQFLKDYSHIAVMQDDVKLKAEARYFTDRGAEMEFLCNVITVNEWRGLNGEEPLPADKGDVYYSDIKDKIGTPKVTAGQMGEQNQPPTGGKSEKELKEFIIQTIKDGNI